LSTMFRGDRTEPTQVPPAFRLIQRYEYEYEYEYEYKYEYEYWQ